MIIKKREREGLFFFAFFLSIISMPLSLFLSRSPQSKFLSLCIAFPPLLPTEALLPADGPRQRRRSAPDRAMVRDDCDFEWRGREMRKQLQI